MQALVGFLILALLAIGGWFLTQWEPRRTADLLPMATTTASSTVDILSRSVNYFEGTSGYLAKPAKEGTYPGVVMIHEWWGLNDHIKQAADDLAAEGYIVLAVDLFNGAVATSADAAMAQVQNLNQEAAINNLQAAVSRLKGEGASKIASLGWCFGGGQSLQLAASGAPLSATVLYYGTPITDAAKLTMVTWPVLGIFGSADQSIATSTVTQFEIALATAGVTNEIHLYPGVGHAFANPSNPNYAKKETADAWKKTLRFLNENLREG